MSNISFCCNKTKTFDNSVFRQNFTVYRLDISFEKIKDKVYYMMWTIGSSGKSCQIIWGNGEHAMSQTHNSFMTRVFSDTYDSLSMRDSREERVVITGMTITDCDQNIIFHKFSNNFE